MPWKIGELARRTGLTVRALHHYDALGLLKPSGRSAAGYRLYVESDLARLHRILALRQLGLSLEDVAGVLQGGAEALPQLIARQIAALDAQMARAAALRARLSCLRDTLNQGGEVPPDEWFNTLEMLAMFDKYFSPDELARLQERKQDAAVHHSEQAWPQLIAAVSQLMADGASPDTSPAIDAALQWNALVRSFTGPDASLQIKSAQMMRDEPQMQQRTGIPPAMLDYVMEALRQARLRIYALYLDEGEMAGLRRHYGNAPQDWLPLIREARGLLAAGAAPGDEAAQAVAERWETLTQRVAPSPVTRAKMRQALAEHTETLQRTGVDDALLAFLARAGVDAAY